jgi:hypothetical protein
MAGTVNVSFGDDNKPQILEVSDAIDSVVVNAPIGGFIPGTNYFVAMLPQTHEQGLTVTLYTATKRAIKTLDKSITVHRSAFGTLDNVDEGLEYEDYKQPIGPDPEGIIVFADDRIKAHCVAAFDTNGDGELSYGEAAAVTDVSTAFTSKLYTSFEEFRYFTGITEVPADWFKDRARLKAISLPAGVTSVGNTAFSGCGAIEKIAVGGTLLSTATMQTVFPDSYSVVTDCEILPADESYSICDQAFRNCSGLTTLTLPEGLRDIGTNAFQNCNNLTRLNIPSIEAWLSVSLASASSTPFYSSEKGHLFIGNDELTSIAIPTEFAGIGAYTFYNCTGIGEASFPESLQSIGSYAFYGCTRLSRINIPSLDNWISLQYTGAASAPFYSASEGHLYFSETELKSIALPQSKTELGQYAFYNCSCIEELTIPSGLVKVNSNAFYGCKSLKKANIANLSAWMGITFENQGAAPFNASGEGHLFFGGKELKEPLIPEEVTAFGNYAFYNCTGFTKMTLEPTVPPTLGSRALAGTRCYFIVWDECLNSYKSSWSSWAARIISEKAPFGEEMVDLGLSVKWGKYNLGATSETDYGFYYAWGETVPKSSYTWSNYIWCNGNASSINKYYDGDGKYLIDLEDDAITMALGDKWRMPTSTEWEELIENCTWEWTTLNGIYGRKVTSIKSGYTDKWIFLPAAGYWDGTSLNGDNYSGLYWSSSLIKNEPYRARCIGFSYDSVNPGGLYERYAGASLRPVYGDLIRVTGVSLQDTKVGWGESVQLTATIIPSTASDKRLIWNISDETVATISSDGNVTPINLGAAKITVKTVDGGYTATCTVSVVFEPSIPEAVDLGLSVKWASFDLGATKPEEYGEYFAWGETEPKEDYSWSTYKWCMNGNYNQLTKYCTNSSYGYNGFTDNKTVLDPEDDAASFNLGGSWRLPTTAEQRELRKNCTWEWTTLNGVYGRKVTSLKEGYTDKWIFLPTAGARDGTSLGSAGSYGFFWSSSLRTDNPNYACDLFFGSDFMDESSSDRSCGFSVRPVSDAESCTKVLSVNKTAIRIAASDQTASFKVGGNASWTVSCDDAALTANPALGSGVAMVTLSFPENTDTENAKVYTVKVSTEDEAPVKEFTVVLTQRKASSATYTLDFATATEDAVNAYTSSWKATCDDFTWHMVNFNNFSNGWAFVRCGQKNSASVASITTAAVMPEAIEKVVITFDTFDASLVNSAKLLVDTAVDFSSAASQTINVAGAAGTVTVEIPAPVENCYYKLELDCKSGSKNGFIQISKVVYTNESE